MDLTVALIGVVAVLGITAIYFWVVRRKGQDQTSGLPAGPEQ